MRTQFYYVFILLIFISGCSDDKVDYKLTIKSVDISDETCGKFININFEDSKTTRQSYVCGLYSTSYNNYYIVEGCITKDNPKNEGTMEILMYISENDQIPEGSYKVLLGSISGDCILDSTPANLFTDYCEYKNTIPIPDYRDYNCGSFVSCQYGRKYTIAEFSDMNHMATGVSAIISPTLGYLCGGGTDPSKAYSVVYVAVAKSCNTNTPPFCWAQIGYGYERFSKCPARFVYSYAEVQGYRYKIAYDFTKRDIPNGIIYECSLDETYGIWNFYIDGWQVFSGKFQSDDYWLTAGDFIQYSAEILNSQDDMVGSLYRYSHCEIRNMRYTRADSSTWNNLTENSNLLLFSDDFDEWMVERVGECAVDIWDVNLR